MFPEICKKLNWHENFGKYCWKPNKKLKCGRFFSNKHHRRSRKRAEESLYPSSLQNRLVCYICKNIFWFFFLRNSLQNACLHKIASWWTVWLTLEILINIRLLRKSLPIIMLTFYQKSTIDLVEVFPNIL